MSDRLQRKPHLGRPPRNGLRHPGFAAIAKTPQQVVAIEIPEHRPRKRSCVERLGIGPDEPDRVTKLRELERRELGAEIAAHSGMTFLARVPEDFRGRLQPAERAGPPGAYAIVSDGERFVVLRSTPALRALQGQSVAVARDAKGRLVVRPGPDHDIGR